MITFAYTTKNYYNDEAQKIYERLLKFMRRVRIKVELSNTENL